MNAPNSAIFQTREQADSYAQRLDAATYELSHGEHSRPEYIVRKIRGRDEFEIYVRYHYYQGTLNARQNGPLAAEEITWMEWREKLEKKEAILDGTEIKP